MKYKVLEIFPGQIKVEFEDKSWAIVPVSPDASLEEIDNSVANYDPDFLPSPEELINKNLSVGQERFSKKMEVSNEVQTNANSSDLIEINHEINPIVDFGKASPFDILVFADYFAQKGDTRLKDSIESKIQTIISNTQFSIDNLISDFNTETLDNETILRLAEAELNAEQS